VPIAVLFSRQRVRALPCPREGLRPPDLIDTTFLVDELFLPE
jgi:hypothetical protein